MPWPRRPNGARTSGSGTRSSSSSRACSAARTAGAAGAGGPAPRGAPGTPARGAEGRDERTGGRGPRAVPGVAQDDRPLGCRLVRLQPGQHGVDGPAGGHPPDAGVAEPGRHQPLQRQVVVGPVDDLRRDAPPGPAVLELGLRAPAAGSRPPTPPCGGPPTPGAPPPGRPGGRTATVPGPPPAPRPGATARTG